MFHEHCWLLLNLYGFWVFFVVVIKFILTHGDNSFLSCQTAIELDTTNPKFRLKSFVLDIWRCIGFFGETTLRQIQSQLIFHIISFLWVFFRDFSNHQYVKTNRLCPTDKQWIISARLFLLLLLLIHMYSFNRKAKCE